MEINNINDIIFVKVDNELTWQILENKLLENGYKWVNNWKNLKYNLESPHMLINWEMDNKKLLYTGSIDTIKSAKSKKNSHVIVTNYEDFIKGYYDLDKALKIIYTD